MIWSLVRTCRRCLTRAEIPLETHARVASVFRTLIMSLDHPQSAFGCPECMPELLSDVGIDRDEWRAAVARARRQPPQ